MYLGEVLQGRSTLSVEGSATSVVVYSSAREAFTPSELADAYKDFEKHGPQYLDAETDLWISTYRFGERVLLIYKEEGTGLVILIHPTSWKGCSATTPRVPDP